MNGLRYEYLRMSQSCQRSGQSSGAGAPSCWATRIERSVELQGGFLPNLLPADSSALISTGSWPFSNIWMQHFARVTQRTASVDRENAARRMQCSRKLREFFQTLKLAVETTNNAEFERKEPASA